MYESTSKSLNCRIYYRRALINHELFIHTRWGEPNFSWLVHRYTRLLESVNAATALGILYYIYIATRPLRCNHLITITSINQHNHVWLMGQKGPPTHYSRLSGYCLLGGCTAPLVGQWFVQWSYRSLINYHYTIMLTILLYAVYYNSWFHARGLWTFLPCTSTFIYIWHQWSYIMKQSCLNNKQINNVHETQSPCTGLTRAIIPSW